MNKFTRRELAPLSAMLAMRTAAAPNAAQPNIVILVADDLGARDVGYEGSEIQTPNIDRLAREGVRLENFYCCPLCSPSRSALMTGRNPVRFGMAMTVIRPWSPYGVPLQEHYISQTLRTSGYQTWAVGKWHMGHAHRGFCPAARGFDQFYGFLNAGIDYNRHISYGGLDWQRDGTSVHESGYSTELLGAEAIRRVRKRDRNRPFFLYLAFNAPHAPLAAPDRFIVKYSHIGNQNRRLYAAALDCMDEQIGRLASTLQDEGIDRNTIILFLGDNGGPQGGGNCLPFRGWKGTVYEGGLRVPAFLRWTGKLAAAQSIQVASIFDVFPTLTAAAGLKPLSTAPLDGVNLWPAISGGGTIARNPLFFAVKANETQRHQYAAISNGWKMVQETDQNGINLRNSLFHLENDPLEKADVLGSEAMKGNELMAEIERWRKLNPPGDIDSSMHPHPGWVPPRDYAAATASYDIAPDTFPEI